MKSILRALCNALAAAPRKIVSTRQVGAQQRQTPVQKDDTGERER
jgi:hypothetical protein